jgi:hypothetical protein
VRDNEGNRPLSQNLMSLTNYEDFLRRHLPHFVRSALDTAVNGEIQPIEERLRGQILDVIEQAQNRAFSTYRAMFDSTQGAEPSLDSGYISNPSRLSSSREGDVNNLTASWSNGELGEANTASEAVSAQFMRTDFDFQHISPTQQDLDFSHMNPSDSYRQTEETVSNDPLALGGDNLSNLSLFPLQPLGLNSDVDPDYFNWDFPMEGSL